MYDIHNFLDFFISSFVGIFTSFFKLLDNINYLSISLLDLILAFLVLSAFIPVVLSFAKGGVRSSRSGYRTRVRSSRRRKNGGDD